MSQGPNGIENSQATTPPYHPTHNVRFTFEKISRIVILLFPSRIVQSVERLESGKSFNNRIYFLRLGSAAGFDGEEAVLKITGRYFGAEKVQNEVASLYLLERYCPDVPAPKVLAWCDDGVEAAEMHLFQRPAQGEVGSIVGLTTISHPPNDVGSSENGWILLSRQPGRLLESSDLVGQVGEQIMKELAYSVSQMRLNIPVADRIGNLKLHTITSSTEKFDSYADFHGNNMQVEIKGLINSPHTQSKSIFSALEYYRTRLENQMAKLLTEEEYAPNRASISPLIESFSATDLPKIYHLSQPTIPTFTHYDISPRNILISGSPPSITGLLDPEFAGFFPPEEEFANDAVFNEGDWPSEAYEVFLGELERFGVKTPRTGFDGRAWKEAILLMQLIEDVAPWELREMGEGGKEARREECVRARESVEGCVEKIRRLRDE